MKKALIIAAVTVVAGCSESANQNATAPAADPGTASSATATPSSAPAANVSYTAGQNLVALQDKAKCRETGPNAGDPWELSKGGYVKFLHVEGAELRVDSGGGIECLVAPDAVGPA